MDDGEYHRSGFILNTSGFTLNDVKLLGAALLSKGRVFFFEKKNSFFYLFARPPPLPFGGKGEIRGNLKKFKDGS
jgi:hypothetical protein